MLYVVSSYPGCAFEDGRTAGEFGLRAVLPGVLCFSSSKRPMLDVVGAFR